MEIIDRSFLGVKTPTCHASTITFDAETGGNPVFAWFGGEREGLSDSSIYIQCKDKIRSIGRNMNIAYWNPVLFRAGGRLFLSYKRGKFCDSWQTYIVDITDDSIKDLDREEAQLIPAGLNFCVKTKPIQDSDGRFYYCGSSVETLWDWTSYIETYELIDGKFVFINRSNPLTVKKKAYLDPFYNEKMLTMGIIQPSLWKDSCGNLNAFFRSSRGLGKIYYATPEDCESPIRIWSEPQETKFKNPNSSIDTVYFNNRLFLVHNPSDTSRIPLVIKELDQYDSFKVVDEITIAYNIPKGSRTNELSYPFMVEHDGKLHLTYTVGRVNIEHVTIEV